MYVEVLEDLVEFVIVLLQLLVLGFELLISLVKNIDLTLQLKILLIQPFLNFINIQTLKLTFGTEMVFGLILENSPKSFLEKFDLCDLKTLPTEIIVDIFIEFLGFLHIRQTSLTMARRSQRALDSSVEALPTKFDRPTKLKSQTQSQLLPDLIMRCTDRPLARLELIERHFDLKLPLPLTNSRHGPAEASLHLWS